jgi:dihydroorotate dehydrogenase (NAD+) catalytic subunit
MDLSADLGKLKIDPNWMNTSGVLTNFHSLRKFPPEVMGARVSKSIGITSKAGFMEPVVYSNDIYTLNCVGLTNMGCKEAEAELKELYPFSVPLIIDVFGTKEEMVEISKTLEKYSDAIQLNFGCPNLTKGENYGLAVGINPILVKEYTKAVRDNISSRKPIIAKLTPNVPDITKIAEAAEDGEADIIAAINTISDGMEINVREKRPILSNKYGGISGPAIKPKGVGCVHKIYETVKLPIIGMGGIRLNTADDYLQYIEAGASACAVGTYLKNKSDEMIERSFKDFRKKIERVCEEMNVSRIKELVGAAHQTKS